jgi:hypothetical protein
LRRDSGRDVSHELSELGRSVEVGAVPGSFEDDPFFVWRIDHRNLPDDLEIQVASLGPIVPSGRPVRPHRRIM